MSSSKDTVKVRIPVVVWRTPKGKGRWSAWGIFDTMASKKADREQLVQEAVEDVPHGCQHRVVWIEAVVEVPVEEVIEGAVLTQ